jgi:hypothetical protein
LTRALPLARSMSDSLAESVSFRPLRRHGDRQDPDKSLAGNTDRVADPVRLDWL